MISEFLYLVKESGNYNYVESLTEYIENVLTTRPSNVQVDLQNNQGETEMQNMRCHFDISYVTQAIGT